ncbi:hypothetical protein HK097_010812 [Rhizophlyctis rosea]|uniref:Uncharacterized protein n=1 Tax=Rhizophlyctis rosea TaxID=64517 RepID=A0AAD5S8I5_9FUNG|nr:hypothetical protein HK097_010812 [Rhizophlyctis rosea]
MQEPSTPDTLSAPALDLAGVPGVLAWEAMGDIVHKRIVTLEYIQRLHGGSNKAYYLSTVLLPSDALAGVYDTPQMKKRALQLLHLGLSIGSLLNVSSPPEFLRVFNTLLNEHDHDKSRGDKDDNTKAKMKSMFLKKSAKSGTAPNLSEYRSLATSEGGGGYTFMEQPTVPIDIDYAETVHTLCEVLIQAYQKLSEYTEGPRHQAYAEGVMKLDLKVKKTINSILKEVDGVSKNLLDQELRRLGLGNLGGDDNGVI